MLEELDKNFVLQTYARNYINFKKGIYATLYDEKNNDYIDFTSGIGVVSIGHGNKKIAKTRRVVYLSDLQMVQHRQSSYAQT